MAEAQLVFSGSEPITLAEDKLVIGRSLNSDIPVNETPVNGTYGVSRRHAMLQNNNGVWSICDMGSVNGTKVNGVPLQPEERVELKDGDVIELGKRVKATFYQPEDYMDGDGTVVIGENTDMASPEDDGTVLMGDPHGGFSGSQNSSSADDRQFGAASSNGWTGSASSNGWTGAGSAEQVTRPADTPASLREYIEKYGSKQQKSQIMWGAILVYISCALSFVIMMAAGNAYVILDVLLLLPLAILVHVRKSKGCAIALVCVGVLELILTIAFTGQISGWLPLAGSILALTAILRADKGYQSLRSASGKPAAPAPSISQGSRQPQWAAPQRPEKKAAPVQTVSRQPAAEPVRRTAAGPLKILNPGQVMESDITLQCPSFTGWRDGRIEIKNDVIVLYAKNMMVRIAFGAVGNALASGKEVMRFDPRDIRRCSRNSKRQIRLELGGSDYAVISGKQDVIDTLEAFAMAANAGAL